MIPILFQDKTLAVCLKPPGLLSQDGPAPSLPDALRQQLGCDIFPVHRLDREAAGVMVFALTGRSAAALSQAVARREFDKQYLCVLCGQPAEQEGVYRDLLFHDQTRNKSFVVQRMRGGVREASLAFRTLAVRDGRSLAAVRLHTGRTHQIRVQFASRGTPLAGDRKYGGGAGDLLLWSAALRFRHPQDGRLMAFCRAPEGGDWEVFRAELDVFRQAGPEALGDM